MVENLIGDKGRAKREMPVRLAPTRSRPFHRSDARLVLSCTRNHLTREKHNSVRLLPADRDDRVERRSQTSRLQLLETWMELTASKSRRAQPRSLESSFPPALAKGNA